MLGSRRHNKVDALKRVPLFAGLGKHDLEAIVKISREMEFAPDEELIAEGEAGREFFVLLEGEAEVRLDGVEINRLGPGDFFGEIALLSDRPTTASVVTSAPARALLIAPRDFRRLLENLPPMQMKVIEALADRMPDAYYGPN